MKSIDQSSLSLLSPMRWNVSESGISSKGSPSLPDSLRWGDRQGNPYPSGLGVLLSRRCRGGRPAAAPASVLPCGATLFQRNIL